ncbi:type VI secretion system tip protein VgrG [Serratia marcescens]|uniref:type VI secretion system Vgr family protein n=1 Tax=Serratia marcescens TaxID=615 RepID=UPI001EF144FB|nr:type VI secretion system Vgr family protein [Serratia marcescens]ULH11527.1 type VI secretion system tip protein VgrG [Serratia marcescens]
MSLTDTLNRYRLTIDSCPSPLDVEDFTGEEKLSGTYRYTIHFTSPDKDIPADQMLRKPASLTMAGGMLKQLTEQKRVHGVITQFERLTSSADQAKYRITLEPKLVLLDRQFRTHRFFINKSVPEVVRQVLQEHGLKNWEYEFSLRRTYPKREQINQYQENDLQFIQRLLAEVGLFYWFTLQPDTQTEVVNVGDTQYALTARHTVMLSSPSGMNDNASDSAWGLGITHNVVEASVSTKDYNHREAQFRLESAPADITRGDGEGVTYGEVYHYKPRHLVLGERINAETESANFYARLDHERFLANQTHITGTSTDAALSPGQVVTLTGGDNTTLPELLQGEILLTVTEYRASRKNALQVSLHAVPYSDTVCWRPALLPRPQVTGTMTAWVTSAKAHDIYAWQDASGLYRVKFDADMDDKDAGVESMPVRLAKPYGGDMYGFHFPLIQGTEVAIGFHEGDPDRPYIAHVMHNSRSRDHVTDKNGTRNVIRTAGLNKLRMEDKRGEEHIKLSTVYGGKTQLNLGHNVNAARELRGEGAELRTDKWVSVRGGAGVFITADSQPAAGGNMLAMREAISQLNNALTIAKSLAAAAEGAQALPSDTESQESLNAALNALSQPGILLNAPQGISLTSPQAVRLASGSASVGIMSQKNTDISALKRFTVAAGEAISILARKAGMKLFAAKGKVEIQAQDDGLDAIAKKDVTITSTEGRVEITAATELIVNCGGAYIKLSGGNIEVGCPGNILLKCNTIQKTGSADYNVPQRSLPQGYSEYFVTRDKDTGDILANTRYRITTSDGEVYEGRTDSEGNTSEIFGAAKSKINIELLGG